MQRPQIQRRRVCDGRVRGQGRDGAIEGVPSGHNGAAAPGTQQIGHRAADSDAHAREAANSECKWQRRQAYRRVGLARDAAHDCL